MNIAPRIWALVLAGIVGLGVIGWLGYNDHQDKYRAAQARLASADAAQRYAITRAPRGVAPGEWAGFGEALLVEAAQANIDYRLVMAIIQKESEWNPRAVSGACAVGLMQVRPTTAADVVKRHNLKNYTPPTPTTRGKCFGRLGSLGQPVWSIIIGIRYLHEQVQQFGMGPVPLRSYNRGPSSALAKWHGDRYAEDVALHYLTLAHTMQQR